MSRLYDVTPAEVDAAWKAVCQVGGGAGYDEMKIKDVKEDEVNHLYKVWNRLSSGSYIPAPVLLGGPTTTNSILLFKLRKGRI